MRKLLYAAPFLVALFSIVTLYQANAERLDPGQMIAPALFGLLVAGVFLLLFWLLKWTAPAAPFIAAIFTGVFLLWHIAPWPVSILILVATLIVGIGSKRHVAAGTILLNILLVSAILVSGVLAGITEAGKTDSSRSGGPSKDRVDKANIYFIVPDRLPSPAAMREAGIDPDKYLTSLRDLNFYVKEDQVSEDWYEAGMRDTFYVETTPVKIHTTRTMRYFASVLNGGADIPLDIEYQACRTMIRDNALFTWLHDKGFTIINIPSWFSETARFTDEDLSYPFMDVNLYERVFRDELGEAYFSRTILAGLNFRVLESFGSQVKVEKARLRWQAQKIAEISAAGPQANFVIAHLTLPHEPYVFADPDDSIPDQYYANIQSALLYLDELAGLIRKQDPTATIIIQSDEGMAYRKPIELNFDLSPVQWSGVFTAWYMPGFTGELDNIKHTEILNIVVNSK